MLRRNISATTETSASNHLSKDPRKKARLRCILNTPGAVAQIALVVPLEGFVGYCSSFVILNAKHVRCCIQMTPLRLAALSGND